MDQKLHLEIKICSFINAAFEYLKDIIQTQSYKEKNNNKSFIGKPPKYPSLQAFSYNTSYYKLIVSVRKGSRTKQKNVEKHGSQNIIGFSLQLYLILVFPMQLFLILATIMSLPHNCLFSSKGNVII